MSSSVTSASVNGRPRCESKSGSSISGRTSTSAVNFKALAVVELGHVDVGLPERLDVVLGDGLAVDAVGSASLTASSSTAPRPKR